MVHCGLTLHTELLDGRWQIFNLLLSLVHVIGALLDRWSKHLLLERGRIGDRFAAIS